MIQLVFFSRCIYILILICQIFRKENIVTAQKEIFKVVILSRENSFTEVSHSSRTSTVFLGFSRKTITFYFLPAHLPWYVQRYREKTRYEIFLQVVFFFRLTCSRRVYFAHFTNKCRPNHFYIHVGITTLHVGISIIARKRWRFSVTPFLAVYKMGMSSHGFLRCVPKTLVISVEVYGANPYEGVKIGFCTIPT